MPFLASGAKKNIQKLLTKQKLEKHVEALRAFVKEHKNKRPPKMAPSGKLRVFSDCAGISSELIALRLLGLTSEHMDFVGGSEMDATKRCMMQCVHRECHMPTNGNAVEKDLFHRSLEATQASDLYIAGFPCPAYSALGKKKGAQDGKGRGLLVFEGLKYIAKWKPSVVVLENVAGFLNKKHQSTHKVMKKNLCCFEVQSLHEGLELKGTRGAEQPLSSILCGFEVSSKGPGPFSISKTVAPMFKASPFPGCFRKRRGKT